jgi:formiminotetrahydrofolate cyclodeaminase
MKLTERTNMEFSKALASEAPAPGGGSAAALSASLGAALAHMVASLTEGKKKYVEYEALTAEILDKSEDLRVKLLDCMDRDTEIFGQMSDAFAMPKSTEEEKAQRSKALQQAMKACSVVPLEIMNLCLNGLELVDRYVGKSNASAASDLGVAALTLKAGMQGAWLNVLINIGGIKDEAFVTEYREKSDAILKKGLPLADKIVDTVVSGL